MSTTIRAQPPLAATISLILCVLLLCSLGIWQIKRLTWKENLLVKIATAQAINPQNHKFHANDLTAQAEWQRGFVRGTYKNDLAIKISPRTEDGKVGYHSVVPFALENGGTILVNRGWFLEGTTVRSEATQIVGTLRLPEKPNRFVPPNDPTQNLWYSIDIQALKIAKNISDLVPVILYAENENPASSPVPHYIQMTANLPNNHLQYALFWFGMAAVLVVFYALRFLRPMRCGDDRSKD